MVYQYQTRNVVYCNAVKIDGLGKKSSEVVISLDTSHIGFAANNKIYSTISSEDKNKLLVFKINSRNRSNYLVTTLLFNNQLTLEKRSSFRMSMDDTTEMTTLMNLMLITMATWCSPTFPEVPTMP